MSQTGQELLNTLKWRYATKRFDPQKKIPPEDVATLKEALRLSPSSYGLQPWIFIDVTDPELRRRLREASYNQSQVTDASHYFVLCYLKKLTAEHIDRHIQNIAKTTGKSVLDLQGFQASMK
ncbi:MAG: nitroreductase family protein, partial [Bdellovibrionaceae bacterium]|nr:nitroreductase family protein [Pseudobdellovibrionaceae bacterium]